MSIQKTIINDIDDLRTGVVTNLIEEKRLDAHHLYVSTVLDGIEFMAHNGSFGYRLRRTQEQAQRMVDDLHWYIEVALPDLENARREAVKAGYDRLVRLLTPVRFPLSGC